MGVSEYKLANIPRKWRRVQMPISVKRLLTFRGVSLSFAHQYKNKTNIINFNYMKNHMYNHVTLKTISVNLVWNDWLTKSISNFCCENSRIVVVKIVFISHPVLKTYIFYSCRFYWPFVVITVCASVCKWIKNIKTKNNFENVSLIELS